MMRKRAVLFIAPAEQNQELGEQVVWVGNRRLDLTQPIGTRVAVCLVFFLALSSFMYAGEPAWRTGRIITVRVMERSEGGAAVTPAVQEDERGQPGSRPEIDTLEKMRGKEVRFRIEGSKLFLRPTNQQPLELNLLFNRFRGSKIQAPQK
jgi:hypothetical protein